MGSFSGRLIGQAEAPLLQLAPLAAHSSCTVLLRPAPSCTQARISSVRSFLQEEYDKTLAEAAIIIMRVFPRFPFSVQVYEIDGMIDLVGAPLNRTPFR